MRVNEEVDALTLIGIHPIQYLVVPRVHAVIIAQMLLGVTSALVGILVGLHHLFKFFDQDVEAVGSF
jgi:phospholipid/cholesterol/gamma-HCH transport system permease protein